MDAAPPAPGQRCAHNTRSSCFFHQDTHHVAAHVRHPVPGPGRQCRQALRTVLIVACWVLCGGGRAACRTLTRSVAVRPAWLRQTLQGGGATLNKGDCGHPTRNVPQGHNHGQADRKPPFAAGLIPRGPRPVTGTRLCVQGPGHLSPCDCLSLALRTAARSLRRHCGRLWVCCVPWPLVDRHRSSELFRLGATLGRVGLAARAFAA